MNPIAWIALSVMAVLAAVPLIREENRTKEEITNVIRIIAIIVGVIYVVLVFNINFAIAMIVGFILMGITNKKMFTKKRLLLIGSAFVILVCSIVFLLRDNPDYIVKHLQKNPETTSLHVIQKGDELISYQSEIARPLASAVKILVAVEYAMQIEDGKLDQTESVPLADLNNLYIKNTDGGAHAAWLEDMNSNGRITNEEVSLHDVAKGMITYSSNANTDYLMNLVGIESIHQRMDEMGLDSHEAFYPIVGALLVPSHIKTDNMSNKQLVSALEKMPMETYRELAIELGDKLREGGKLPNELYLTMDVQKVWSDRLIGASAEDYAQMMGMISNSQFPPVANEVMRDLLEWPMEYNEGNKDRFSHLGMKGGSTGFILNQALYAETLNGDKSEIVVLTDDLSLLQMFFVQRNMNSFLSKLIGSEEYRLEVQKILATN